MAPADMPAHFRPEHLGRASARFDESQLVHWQKGNPAAHVGHRDPHLARIRRVHRSFVELVRHNIVLPADAAPYGRPWSIQGDLAPLGDEEQRVIGDRRGRRVFRSRHGGVG